MVSPKRFGFIQRFSKGVKAFMISIAKATPSGYEPQILISMVISPQPIPKIICARVLTGDDTMSVAI